MPRTRTAISDYLVAMISRSLVVLMSGVLIGSGIGEGARTLHAWACLGIGIAGFGVFLGVGTVRLMLERQKMIAARMRHELAIERRLYRHVPRVMSGPHRETVDANASSNGFLPVSMRHMV